MKKMAMIALVLMMAFVLSAPVVFAQQQTAQPQAAGWNCPMMSQAAQGGWYCPMMKAAGQGGWYCPMMNQSGTGHGTMGYGCMMYRNQAQPLVRQ